MLIKNLYKKVKNNVYDLIFPKFCIGCNLEGVWLCEKCKREIVPVISQVCPDCGRLSPHGKFCHRCKSRCKKGKTLKGVISSAYFNEGPLKEIVHNFKYNSVTEMADFLSMLMAKSLTDNLKTKFLLSFVPLHPRKQAMRGYNQSELLARGIAKWTGFEVLPLLMKKKATQRQVELKGAQRRRNLIGNFGLLKKQNIKGEKIIIIDDITTTGTTLNECARILVNAGAKEVWGLVISRG